MATATDFVRRPGSVYLLPDYVTEKTREFTRFVKLILDSACYLIPTHRSLSTAAGAIATVYNSWDWTDLAQSILDVKNGTRVVMPKKDSTGVIKPVSDFAKRICNVILASDLVNGVCNVVDWLCATKIINLACNFYRNFSIAGGLTLCFSFGARAVTLYKQDKGLSIVDKCDLATDVALFAIGAFATFQAVFAYNFVLAYLACATVRVTSDFVKFLYTKPPEPPKQEVAVANLVKANA
ncbi:MAG: hypothetical protein HZB76_02180 [Chlamydiae bacterium]|nr:hypothetical protein [Chlamydiota bacterium]